MSHLTVAASENAFRLLFADATHALKLKKKGKVAYGSYWLEYDIAAHLDKGTVDLRSDGTVRVSGLDIKWDTLKVDLAADIPGWTIGGGCLDIGFMEFCLPSWSIFGDNPDIDIPLDLSGVLTSEISLTAIVKTRHVSPGGTMSDRWDVYLHLPVVSIDIFDVAAMAQDLFNKIAHKAIDDALGWLPGFVKDIVYATMGGSVVTWVLGTLDLPDNVRDWLEDELRGPIGLADMITSDVANWFMYKRPLTQVLDPYEIMPATAKLQAVRVPIADLEVTVDDAEMTLRASIGSQLRLNRHLLSRTAFDSAALAQLDVYIRLFERSAVYRCSVFDNGRPARHFEIVVAADRGTTQLDVDLATPNRSQQHVRIGGVAVFYVGSGPGGLAVVGNAVGPDTEGTHFDSRTLSSSDVYAHTFLAPGPYRVMINTAAEYIDLLVRTPRPGELVHGPPRPVVVDVASPKRPRVPKFVSSQTLVLTGLEQGRVTIEPNGPQQ